MVQLTSRCRRPIDGKFDEASVRIVDTPEPPQDGKRT
jgi:hypothetical protein